MVFPYCEGIGDVSCSCGRSIHRRLYRGVSYAYEVGVEFSALSSKDFSDEQGLIISARKSSFPVQGDGEKIFDIVAEWSGIERGFCKVCEDWSELAVGVLESKDHVSQCSGVCSGPDDLVEIELLLLTGRAGVIYQAVFSGVSAAAVTVASGVACG